jgi:peptidylamidoglycolate lyase
MRLADYSLVENWPTTLRNLGAISAVALDVYKNVVVFHRDDRVWNSETFDLNNVFQKGNLGPITDNTIVTFDRVTGNVVSEWGKNMFYMPHGLHINGNYYYVTDVALQQVFRFNVKNSTKKPDLILGEAFKPGRSAKLFCKPTSVASLEWRLLRRRRLLQQSNRQVQLQRREDSGGELRWVGESMKHFHMNSTFSGEKRRSLATQ